MSDIPNTDNPVPDDAQSNRASPMDKSKSPTNKPASSKKNAEVTGTPASEHTQENNEEFIPDPSEEQNGDKGDPASDSQADSSQPETEDEEELEEPLVNVETNYI